MTRWGQPLCYHDHDDDDDNDEHANRMQAFGQVKHTRSGLNITNIESCISWVRVCVPLMCTIQLWPLLAGTNGQLFKSVDRW